MRNYFKHLQPNSWFLVGPQKQNDVSQQDLFGNRLDQIIADIIVIQIAKLR
ncbi:MAG: hypothetical protein JSR85_03460 [Proteobacteria bacterium]|nr:hypothetical protein [Pseudomonadota bacterium]